MGGGARFIGVAARWVTAALALTIALAIFAPLAQSQSLLSIANHTVNGHRYDLLSASSKTVGTASSFWVRISAVDSFVDRRPTQVVAIRGGVKPGGGRYKVGFSGETCVDCVALISSIRGGSQRKNSDSTWVGLSRAARVFATDDVRYVIEVGRHAPAGATFEMGFVDTTSNAPSAWRGTTRSTFTITRIVPNSPRLRRATVEGRDLWLIFDKTLKPDGVGMPGPYGPPEGSFTVMSDGFEVPISATDIRRDRVLLQLARPVTHREQNVTVTLHDVAVFDGLRAGPDSLGIEGPFAARFWRRPVTNLLDDPVGAGSGGSDGNDVFYGIMTAGRSSGNLATGYADGSTGIGVAIGNLLGAATGFQFEGTDYPVLQLVLFDNKNLSLRLRGALTKADAALLELHVNGAKLDFSAASFIVGTSITAISWTATSLSAWTGGQGIPVLIVDKNLPPVFTMRRNERSRRPFLEYPAPGEVITSVGATDPEGDEIIYSLEGPDGDSFVFDPDTNEIFVRQGVIISYDQKRTYVVDVRATDEWGLSSIWRLTFDVEPLPETVPDDVPGTPTLSTKETGAGANAVSSYGSRIDLYFSESLRSWNSRRCEDYRPPDGDCDNTPWDRQRFRPDPKLFTVTATGAGGGAYRSTTSRCQGTASPWPSRPTS